jgi:hypothetical protein
MRIQAFLTAAAVNLKRLAAALGVLLSIPGHLVLAVLQGPWMKRRELLAGPVASGTRAA